MKVNFTRILAVALAGGLLSAYGFNCAESGMHSMDFSSSSSMLSSEGPGGAGNDDPYTETPVSGGQEISKVLMTSEQMFQSMLNVTAQSTVTNTQNNEYQTRTSSLPGGNSLGLINSPTLLSATSLAGEVCNGLLARERGLMAAQRRYFALTNFNAPVSATTATEVMNTVQVLAQNFWGRAPAAEETQLFVDFRTEFISTLTPQNANQAQQTSNMYLSICSAMLSSFEFLTY